MQNFSTVMQQLLQFIPKAEFSNFVGQHNGDKWTKHFSTFNQLAVMLYAQASKKMSLRDIQIGLQIQSSSWYHLGLKSAAKSTIADANSRRDYQIFEKLFYALLKRCQGFFPTTNQFKFKNPLYSLDCSDIDLCLKLFNWARYKQEKGAVRLHTLLDNRTQIPEFLVITDGKTKDVSMAERTWSEWNLPKESILVFDKGYLKFSLFRSWKEQGLYFVTRAKTNMNYYVVEEKPTFGKSVVSDQIIKLNGDGRKGYPDRLRLVIYWDSQKEKFYKFLTNNFRLSAKTIADIYKNRWQIELFFKWIKQNLKIKTFLGTSKNAVLTQIWIAMIYYLILAYIKAQTKTSLSMLELSRVFQNAFFERVSIIDLLTLKPASLAKALTCCRGSPQLSFF